MQLNKQALENTEFFADRKIKLPVRFPANTAPCWVHFGAGNIFRGYIARLQQELLDLGLSDRGIIAVDPDRDMLEKVYDAHDNLTLLVSLGGDGNTDLSVIGSVNEAVYSGDWARLREIFISDTLQLCTFTITEKGYSLGAQADLDTQNAPCKAKNTMCLVCALLYERYKASQLPLAVVSIDNCSRNGEKLSRAIRTAAEQYVQNQQMEAGFLDYLKDEKKVSFPWSMIDKITPRPDDAIGQMLESKGLEGMLPLQREHGAPTAPFVNAEQDEYLVMEDAFPAGRPPLEKAGVYMTDRKTVNLSERMKVTACLNPLHTAMATLGCMLGYTRISAMMQDEDVVRLIRAIGEEGMRVVQDPGIISPRAFITRLLENRLPNPYIPDMPQRIASDTSQKVGIRYGETIKAYLASDLLSEGELKAIPFAIAAWLRYLLKKDDLLQDMPLSPDPMLEELTGILQSITPGMPGTLDEAAVDKILSNEAIFGSNLCNTLLRDQILGAFTQMLEGKGAVRRALHEAV